MNLFSKKMFPLPPYLITSTVEKISLAGEKCYRQKIESFYKSKQFINVASLLSGGVAQYGVKRQYKSNT